MHDKRLNDKEYVNLVTGLGAEHETLAWQCLLKGLGEHDLAGNPDAQALGITRANVHVFMPWDRHKTGGGRREGFRSGYIDVDFARGYSCGYDCHFEVKVMVTGHGGVPSPMGCAVLEGTRP